jgi:UDP-N-acetylmuramoyl-tripeptide--D-alanyl-D-alanine ligase
LAAAAIAKEVPVSAEAIRAGLASVSPLFGRSEILHGPVTVIRDCYNANPESVKEVIDLGDALAWQGQRIYVIGSMLELGAASEAAHKLIGRYLADSKADIVCFYGPETAAAATVLRETVTDLRCFHTNVMDEVKRFLAAVIQPGDLVLLKGSRGCALEQLTDMLMTDKGVY